MNAITWQDLGRRLAAGDASAVGECYRELAPAVRRYARRHVPVDDVDDVVQLVFIEVWRCRERFDPERGLEAWVLRIARNRAIDHLRARWRHDRRSVPLELVIGTGGDRGAGGARGSGAGGSGGAGGVGGVAGVGAASLARALTGLDGRYETARVDEASDLRDALGALPGAQREVIELAYFGDLSQREIAERTGTPLGTVKARTARGLNRLNSLLAA